MDYSAPLGPGLVARLQVCRPGEQLLWAISRRVFYYDVEGLDPLGAPRRSALARGASAVGRGVGDFALTAVGGVLFGGTEDEGSDDKPLAPDLLVFGAGPGCLAHDAVSRIGAAPGERWDRLWVLTSARLVVFGGPPPKPESQQEPEAEPQPRNRSLLSKAVGFGKGVVDFGKGVAEVFGDKPKTYGFNVEGEPVRMPTLVQWHEFPREQVASVGVTTRRMKLRGVPVVRVSLVDGSGLDFLLEDDPDVLTRVTEMTNGAE